MTIYTASKTIHAPRWRALRAAGYQVAATWIDEAGQGQTPDIADLAVRCVREAAAADIMLLYCEPGDLLKGALIEAGAALAFGRQVRCVGFCESLSPLHRQHPCWSEFATVEEALFDAR